MNRGRRSVRWAAAAVVMCASAASAQVRPAEPPHPTYTDYNYHNTNAVMPRRGAGDSKLLVLIHGWRDDPTMWATFRTQLGTLPAGWVVWEYDWHEDADRLNFLTAVENTTQHFNNLTRQIVLRGRIDGAGMWDHVHLASHSLGSMINEGTARRIKGFGVGTTQQTYLDPALDREKAMRTWFGNTADVAENYFASGNLVGATDFIGQTMTKCVNVDTTASSPYNPITQPSAHHKWPVEWYGEGIAGTARVPQSTYGSVGWGLSRELAKTGGTPATRVWPPATYAGLKGKLHTLNGAGEVASSETLAAAVETPRTPGVMVADRSGPNAASITDPTDNRVTGLDMSASSSGRAWAILDVDTSSVGSVNVLKFDYRFPQVSARAGFLSAFVVDDTNPADPQWLHIWNADESMNLAGDVFQSYEPIALQRRFDPGMHALAFTWDTQDGLPTTVEVRNIRFSDVPEPGSLSLLLVGGLALRRRLRAARGSPAAN